MRRYFNVIQLVGLTGCQDLVVLVLDPRPLVRKIKNLGIVC